MKRSSRAACAAIQLLFAAAFAAAEALASPTWGFRLDPPEGYQYVEGDARDRFSFSRPSAAAGASGAAADCLDLVAYPAGRYASAEAAAADVAVRIGSEGERAAFDYRGRAAVMAELAFQAPWGPAGGWGLFVELDGAEGKRPVLAALAYGPDPADPVHLSVLDSIAPSAKERLGAGPVAVFAYPPTTKVKLKLAGLDAEAWFDAADAEAAASTIKREFAVLSAYDKSPLWKEAWSRFYRAVYRDASGRLAHAAFEAERALSAGIDPAAPEAVRARKLAEEVLAWVQGFAYERDLMGADFVDLATAVVEGRGDCDSRAMLAALVLSRAGVPSSMMVSREFGHAMALVQVEGSGARFEHGGKAWVVAETTAKVPLGLIGKNVSDGSKWLGIGLE